MYNNRDCSLLQKDCSHQSVLIAGMSSCLLERRPHVRGSDIHRLDLGVELNCLDPALLAYARLLAATKWQLARGEVVLVNPGRAGLEGGGHAVRTRDVLVEHCRSEPKVAVIGQRQRLFLCCKLLHTEGLGNNCFTQAASLSVACVPAVTHFATAFVASSPKVPAL